MNSIIQLIPLLPLLGFLINGLGGKRLPEKVSGVLASATVGLSFLVSLFFFFTFLGSHTPFHQSLFSWLKLSGFEVPIAYSLDSLSLVMVLIVTGVGFLIHVYSIGYMKGDPGIQRYFAYLNLFTFMMLNLVMADNFLLMFLGWEGVGLCSYLLIGYWFEDPAKAAAGKKAFIVNRIGDFGFLLAMFLIVSKIGSLQFDRVLNSQNIALLGTATATAIALLLFLGATGKSAQIPLYVWLPDAMAGPTPVSALIHAATMVTAGVYLIVRCSVLFTASELTMSVVSTVGVATAFFAATIAITENDIKKILAYSTISQLGYMFTAVGVGAFSAGIFHLMTHAFFKALLFLGAGCVIHGLHGEQDIRNMGGLKNPMPKTYWTMLAGVSAISGLPLLSGFFSKDEILWNAYSSQLGGNFIYAVGLITAVLTAFYMFRLFILTFHGNSRWNKNVHPHESPSVMTVPLIVLAFFSIGGGYIGIPESLGGHNHFHHFVSLTSPDAAKGEILSYQLLSENILMMLSGLASFLGLGLAYAFYVKWQNLPEKISDNIQFLYRFISQKYFVDELYHLLFVNPLRRGSEFIWRAFDIRIIDASVNGSGKFVLILGERVRLLQSGGVQNYAVFILGGIIAILSYVYLR